jgi:predicted Zn-dependent peptidase
MRFQALPGAGKVLFVLISLALLAGTAAAADNPFGDPRQVPVPELNKIQDIKPQRIELKNGMVVYFLEDHDFPVVDVRALIRVGGIYEPADKTGLASITGQVMRTGGSTKTDGDSLDELLESLGASVETGIGDTQGFASVSTLSEDLEKGLRILSEILRSPAFPQDKIDLAKKQERTAIASRNDEHLNILFREMMKIIYGADHPYARHTEYATIDAITRDDLVAFHKKYIHPDRMLMTVYGDFNKGKVEKLLTQIFGDWARSTETLPPDPVVEQSKATGTFVANKEDLTNSVVVVGQEGMRMDNPDYAAMQVFHEILGGGFSSRLVNEIRSKRGLAYATGSFSGAGMHHPGPQGFYVITQADSTIKTLGYLDAELEKALAEPPTEVELKQAKDSILNSLVFSLSSKGAVLNRMANYEFYGYPQDFLDKYQEAVANMTADEVLAAAKRNLRFPDIATLIVGEEPKFKADLDARGPYEEIDISIPEPAGAEIPDATPADLEKGQSLLAAAAAATGGDALGKIQDMTVEETGTLSVQGMELQVSATTVKKLPDCERSDAKLPMATMIQTLCGDSGWMDVGRGPQAMPPDMASKMEAERERDLLHLLTSYSELELQALPAGELEGKAAEIVYVRSGQTKGWKIFLDPGTHRVLGMEYRDEGMDGSPVLATEILGEYKEVDGVAWPHSRKLLHDGDPFITMNVTAFKINTGVDDSQFKMPE